MIGPLEMALIVVAIVLVFGVGKLGDVGAALGRGIREFKQEVNTNEPEKLEDGEHKNM